MDEKIDPNTMLNLVNAIAAIEMTTISLDMPVMMLDTIDHIVEDETMGFENREEFFREAFRRMVMTYG